MKSKLFFCLILSAVFMNFVVFSGSRKPILQVCFVIDVTGSMSDEIAEVKGRVNEIIDDFHNKFSTIELSLVAYRDKKDGSIAKVVDFTSNINSFKTKIRDLEARGGGDIAEDLLAALKKVPLLSWKDKALKQVFIITDAPTHWEYDSSFSIEEFGKRAIERGVNFNIIVYPPGTDDKNYEQLARITDGRYLAEEEKKVVFGKVKSVKTLKVRSAGGTLGTFIGGVVSNKGLVDEVISAKGDVEETSTSEKSLMDRIKSIIEEKVREMDKSKGRE